jgi:hypothetical protein
VRDNHAAANPVANWLINLAAAYGVLILLAAVTFSAVWAGLNAASRRLERRRAIRSIPDGIHQLERHANNPDNRRKEGPRG